jgi:ribose transport system substrate-binding protein
MRGSPEPARLMVVAAWAAAAALGALPACKKEAAVPPPQPAGTGGAPEMTGKPLRIAMIAKSSSNPAFLSARTGAEDRARELSAQIGAPIEIAWLTPAQEDGQVQAQRILQAVNERVDAILISCSDDQKVSDAIDDAVARGVAVMTFDSDAPRSRRFSYCGVDDFKIGERVMGELAGLLPAKSKAPIQVAVLAGTKGSPNLRRRVDGVMAEAGRHPQLKVVGTFFHFETPQDASAELLRAQAAHPDIAGWAMVGGWPLYNKTLLSDLESDAGRARYKIVSVNAFPPQLVYVEKGFAPVLLAQPTYRWGAVGVESIVAKLVQKKDVPALIPMELVRVTATELGSWARQLKAWGFGDVPEEYLRLR